MLSHEKECTEFDNLGKLPNDIFIFPLKSIIIVLLRLNVTSSPSYLQEYFIDKLWRHEEFGLYSFNDNDIALVKVEAKDGRGIR